MRASSARATHLLLLPAAAAVALASLPRLSEGFLGSPTASATSTGQQRCTVPRMALTPPRKPNSGASAGSAAAGGDENGNTPFGADDMLKTSSRIARAPLRITPNFQPQEKRRPKTEEQRWDLTHGAFLTEESFDIAAMAWEEFSDFLRRTVERNVNGAQFDFDTRQWSSSIRKWWSRAVEMDVQAKADMFKLYDSSVGQRDAWGNQAIKVDARVEDEWDSIYVDCQDSTDVEYQDFSSYDSSGDPSGDGSSGGVFSSIDGGIQGVATDRGTGNARSPGSAAAAPAQSRREGESWRASSSSSSSGGSRSALMAAMDAYQAAVEGEEDKEGEEEERGGGSKGFDEEDIIDCAIRGRWTFKNDHDPPHFSPQ